MKETVYIFDADGVLNNPPRNIVDQRIVQSLATLLKEGNQVAINTGRGYPWVRDAVVTPLRALANDADMDKLCVSAEMGGVLVTFRSGVEQDERTAFGLTPDQIAKVQAAYERHQSTSLQWYAGGKLTMATIQRPEPATDEEFKTAGAALVTELEDMFRDDHVKVLHNYDAIDVTTQEAGKWAGAQLIYDWLQTTSAATAQHFICFGDNTSDYDMASFYASQGKAVQFVFTGVKLGNIQAHDNIDVVQTPLQYADGTAAFLSEYIG